MWAVMGRDDYRQLWGVSKNRWRRHDLCTRKRIQKEKEVPFKSLESIATVLKLRHSPYTQHVLPTQNEARNKETHKQENSLARMLGGCLSIVVVGTEPLLLFASWSRSANLGQGRFYFEPMADKVDNKLMVSSYSFRVRVWLESLLNWWRHFLAL